MITLLTVLFGLVLIAFAVGTYHLIGDELSPPARVSITSPFWVLGICAMLTSLN